MEINDKTNILLSLLAERYNASHMMRERSFSFATWILGSGTAFIWLLYSSGGLTNNQKIGLTVFVAVTILLTLYFLYSIHRGFRKNRNIIIDIEAILGCYQAGLYIPGKTLFPLEYANSNKSLNKAQKFSSALRSHFATIYIWTAAIAFMVIWMIWTSPLKPTNEEQISTAVDRWQQIESTNTIDSKD